MTDKPEDPFTSTAAGAIGMHELYRAFVEAGFSEEQAFIMILESLKTTIANNRPQ